MKTLPVKSVRHRDLTPSPFLTTTHLRTNNDSTGSLVPSQDNTISCTASPDVRTNDSPIRATVVDIRHSTSLKPVQQCATVQHNNTKIASTPLDEDT